MEYHDTVERSTELLRKALPLMSRQAAALHPLSYAVWYAYVADVNSPLHQALDAHLAVHGVLDEAATEALYRRHLADPDTDTAQHVTDDVGRLLDGMQASAAAAGDCCRASSSKTCATALAWPASCTATARGTTRSGSRTTRSPPTRR